MKSFKYILSRGPKGEAVCVVADDASQQRFQLQPDNSLNLYKHSPDGFEWGYAGSGPAQLALAIMLDYFTRTFPGDNSPHFCGAWALNLYQQFKRAFIQNMPRQGGVITQEQIEAFVNSEAHKP